MWMLVVLSTYHFGSNVAVTPITTFGSKQTCEDAGVVIATATKTAFGPVAFACVEKK